MGKKNIERVVIINVWNYEVDEKLGETVNLSGNISINVTRKIRRPNCKREPEHSDYYIEYIAVINKLLCHSIFYWLTCLTIRDILKNEHFK